MKATASCRDCERAESFEGPLVASLEAVADSGRWITGNDGFCRCSECAHKQLAQVACFEETSA
jgi:hypothetical protein